MELTEIISSGLLELYALGMTSPEETITVEEWVKQYPEVRLEIDAIQSVMEEYALAHAVTPDASLKDRIMSEVGFPVNSEKNPDQVIETPASTAQQLNLPANDTRREAVVYTMNSYFKWAAAACFILLIGSLALAYSFYNKYKAADTNLALVRSDLAKERDLAKNMYQQINMITDKNSLPISLNGTPHSPQSAAKIFWMKNTGEVYVAPSALPDVPAGMQYQLWAIVDGQPVDAGMISNSKGNTYKIQKMKSFGKAQAFAITLEKQGGSLKPDMEKMFVMAETKI